VIAFEHRASHSNVGELSGKLSNSGAFQFSTGNDGSGDLLDLEESLTVLEETRSSSIAEFWDKSGFAERDGEHAAARKKQKCSHFVL